MRKILHLIHKTNRALKILELSNMHSIPAFTTILTSNLSPSGLEFTHSLMPALTFRARDVTTLDSIH